MNPTSPEEANRHKAALRAKLAERLDGPTTPLFEPPPIADHTLLYRIGEGACGEVWLARSALGTLRAVKIVYRARFKDDRPYEREFEGILKYEPISRSHEGLVQVLHVGRKDEAGCFYYVMELADDATKPEVEDPGSSPSQEPEPVSLDAYTPRTLRSELARHRRLSPTEAAQFTLRLAKALGHLHEHGLIHRDIKPSNVIFVSGQPKLADIGLVTDVGSSHSFVGTEGFIPPEGPGTPQADLYAVGKLLYELATGKDRLDFPQLPPHLPQLPDGQALLELNEVVTRACAPRPADRYATATELQAELNLFLAGRSLRRVRHIEGYLARIRKLATISCVLSVVAVAALWVARREERHALERAAAETALRHRAEAAERQSKQQLYTALLEQARATVRSGELGQRVRALDAIRRAAAISNSVELRREVLAALALPDLRLEKTLPLDPEVTLHWLDPKFERLALCRGSGPVEIRATSDYRLLTTLSASTNLKTYVANWSPDGRFVAIKRDYDRRGDTNDVEVWTVDPPQRVLLIREAQYDARSYHPTQPKFVTTGSDGSLTTWDLEQGKPVSRHQLEATGELLACSPEGDRIAVSYERPGGCRVAIHDAATGAQLLSRLLTNWVAALAWHPGGDWLALTDEGGEVSFLNSRNGELRTLGRHKGEAVTAVFSPDGDYLLTGGWERELICWNTRTWQRAFTISLNCWTAQFRADGRACALLTAGGVQLHSFERPTAHRHFLEDLGSRLDHATFSPNGRWLAASASKRVAVWDLTGGASAGLAEIGAPAQLYWTSDSAELYGSSRGENCYRWRVQPGIDAPAPPILQRLPLAKPEGFLTLSLSSNFLVWTGNKGTRITGLHNGATGTGNTDWIETARGLAGLSPDGRWLGIYRSYGKVLNIYRLPELSRVASLTNQDLIGGFSFSPLQDEIGVGCRSEIEFWSTTTWQRTRSVTNFLGILNVGMLYQPDGRSVWLVTNFRTTGLYNTRTLQPMLYLPSGMIPVALSANGRHLAVSLDMQRLEVWDLAEVRKTFQELGVDWPEP